MPSIGGHDPDLGLDPLEFYRGASRRKLGGAGGLNALVQYHRKDEFEMGYTGTSECQQYNS
jgi:hypothetical protein